MTINRDAVYLASAEVVARKIEDEFLLVPIAAGIGDMEDELYTLNDTAREIWERLAPGKTVQDLARELATEYDAPENVIAADIAGILSELLRLNMVYENK